MITRERKREIMNNFYKRHREKILLKRKESYPAFYQKYKEHIKAKRREYNAKKKLERDNLKMLHTTLNNKENNLLPSWELL